MIATPRQAFEIIKHHFKSEKKKFVIHNCSQCEYPCGFYWENDQLLFDSGCWCLQEKEKPALKNDDELFSYVINNLDHVEEVLRSENILLI